MTDMAWNCQFDLSISFWCFDQSSARLLVLVYKFKTLNVKTMFLSWSWQNFQIKTSLGIGLFLKFCFKTWLGLGLVWKLVSSEVLILVLKGKQNHNKINTKKDNNKGSKKIDFPPKFQKLNLIFKCHFQDGSLTKDSLPPPVLCNYCQFCMSHTRTPCLVTLLNLYIILKY